jgi:hypothetical protein
VPFWKRKRESTSESTSDSDLDNLRTFQEIREDVLRKSGTSSEELDQWERFTEAAFANAAATDAAAAELVPQLLHLDPQDACWVVEKEHGASLAMSVRRAVAEEQIRRRPTATTSRNASPT